MTKKSTKEKVQKKINNKIISIKKKLNAQDNVVKHWADNDNGSSMLVSEADINVTVGETGYATFYSSSNVAIPAGVQAYVVSAANTSATLTPVTGVLPANTGVILKNAGEYAFKISTEKI